MPTSLSKGKTQKTADKKRRMMQKKGEMQMNTQLKTQKEKSLQVDKSEGLSEESVYSVLSESSDRVSLRTPSELISRQVELNHGFNGLDGLTTLLLLRARRAWSASGGLHGVYTERSECVRNDFVGLLRRLLLAMTFLCKSVLICGCIWGFLFCSYGFAVVSDTQSFFETSGSSFSADGSSCIVSIYIRDANNMPLQDKAVNISTARGSACDSIVQPQVTDVQGQCTGMVSSLYGGWDTITVICDGKNIGSPNQWVQTSQEDFAQGETNTNIDTTAYSGSIKIFYQFLNSDIPNNDFESGLDLWTVEYSDGEIGKRALWVQTSSIKYQGNYSVKTRFEDDTSSYLSALHVQIKDAGDNNLWIGEWFSSSYNWEQYSFGTITWKGQQIKLVIWAQQGRNDLPGALYTKLHSNYFKCSGEVISFYYRKDTNNNLYVDFVKGGRWEEIAPNSATYISRTYDTGTDTPPYGVFSADYTTNGQTISFAVRTADTKDGIASAIWYPAVNSGSISAPRKRWIQWRCQMQTGNTDTSPLLNGVTINYRAPKNIYFVPVLKVADFSASPNPFSPNSDSRKDTTTISYTLIDNNPRDTVCLRIYNPPQQQVVRTLLNYAVQDTGPHQIEWDGRSDTGALVTENGSYVCQITSIDSVGNSVVNTTPITVDLTKPIPQITKVSLGKQQVGLTFEANEPIEFYYVERSDGNTANFQIIASGVSAGDFLDTNPIGDNQNYYYKVMVSDIAGNTQTTNTAFARMTQDGGILSNADIFAIPNTIVRCKDEAQSFVTIPETKTFGDTIGFVKINITKKSRSLLESEGKVLPVDKKLAGCYEITAKELDSNYNELRNLSSWLTGKLVKLTLRYDNCPSDKTSNLAIYEWSSNQWVRRGGEVNTGEQTLNLNVSHFSVYAIMYQTTVSFTGAKPNPFTPNADGINDYVEIRFENSQNQEVKLSIFDLPGHLVWSKSYSAGTTSVFWDGKDFSNRVVEGGVYIYQVEIGAKIVNGVVVVAK